MKLKIAFIMLGVLVTLRYAWVRTFYTCNLTGQERTIDRVFFVPVHITTKETEMSHWLDERLGPTDYRLWFACAHQTVFGKCRYAICGQSVHVYQIYNHEAQVTEDNKLSEMELLRQSRKEIHKSTKWAHFEIIGTNIDHTTLSFTEENRGIAQPSAPPNHRKPSAPVVGGR